MTTVLDSGYVDFVEAWGVGKSGQEEEGRWNEYRDHERGIIEAARQSTQGAFRGWEIDEKLLNTLVTLSHNTPFEFSGMTIEVQAPIFVLREWHRHRTQGYNEMSARYAALPDLYYTPDWENLVERGQRITRNKQATGVVPFDVQRASVWYAKLSATWVHLEALYQEGLAAGVPKEVARISMPVSHYTRQRATGNLRNWIAFITLRNAPDAQWEIRQFAALVEALLDRYFPHTMLLWKTMRADAERRNENARRVAEIWKIINDEDSTADAQIAAIRALGIS